MWTNLPNQLSLLEDGSKIHFFDPQNRSMFSRPRHHGPRWAGVRGKEVRWAVSTIARALGAGNRRQDWRGPSRPSRQPRSPVWLTEPRGFANAPSKRPFPRNPEPWRWRPAFNRNAACGMNWQHETKRAFPRTGDVQVPEDVPLLPQFGYHGGTSKVC